MRYAIISDVHANLAAFKEVLADIAKQHIEGIWCLGDMVGYGPHPNECLDLLRGQKQVCIAGNHDWGSIGRIGISEFNRDAAYACQWTGTVLTGSNAEFLRDLPQILEDGAFTFAHGSPRRPLYEYILNAGEAASNLGAFKTQFCLVGHSHIPLYFRDAPGSPPVFKHFDDREEIKLGEGRYIINPGSVGQPRDGDPRGSYALYDADKKTVTLYRIAYDIGQTQERMRKDGMPSFLIERLARGI